MVWHMLSLSAISIEKWPLLDPAVSNATLLHRDPSRPRLASGQAWPSQDESDIIIAMEN